MFQRHFSLSAERADSGINSGDASQKILPGFLSVLRGFLPTVNAEEFLAYGQLFISAPIAQDSIVSDFHESVGQDVQEKAADELPGVKGQELDLIVVVAVSISQSDHVIF